MEGKIAEATFSLVKAVSGVVTLGISWVIGCMFLGLGVYAFLRVLAWCGIHWGGL